MALHMSNSQAKTMYSRRDVLRLSGALAVSLSSASFLVGCGPAPRGIAQKEASNANGSNGDGLGDGTTLRVGMEAAYAPYNWQVSKASVTTIPIENVAGAYADGYDVQIARRIADALGMEAVAVKLDFDTLIDALGNGQIDIVCAGMSVTPEREQSADFSTSYIDDDIVMITTKDSSFASATQFTDLARASILGQSATMYDEVIDQIPNVHHMVPAESVPLVVQGLSSGTADIITYSKLSAPKLLEAYPNFVQLQMQDAFEGSLMPDNAAIAKGNTDVLQKINGVIKAIPDAERQELWNACMDRQPA